MVIAHDLPAALNHPDRGQLTGIGLSPEAIETNPALYDLFCEMTWHRQAVDLSSWTAGYAARRYGQQLEAAEQAWTLLRETGYDSENQLLVVHGILTSVICQRPSLDMSGGWRVKSEAQMPRLVDAWRRLLSCADQAGKASGYRRDLVDVSLQGLTHIAESLHTRMVNAYHRKDVTDFHQLAEQFLQTIDDMDQLAGTSPEYLLGRWIASARRHGETAAEQAKLEWNARNLLTLWGAPDSILHDYSCRYWSGLLNTFYRRRWELFIQQVEQAFGDGAPFDARTFERDVTAFEDAWTHDTTPMTMQPFGDSVSMVRQLFAHYRPFLEPDGGAMT